MTAQNFLSNAGIAFLLLISLKGLNAQENVVNATDSLDKKILNWYNFDPDMDKVMGVAVDKLYQEVLTSRKPLQKIVVAVIDGGVDIDHPELQGKIWTNKDEIAGNNIDDDNNGYIDDIHGWNFLGNARGENIEYENLEQVRLIKKYSTQFENIPSVEALPESMKREFETYQECQKMFQKDLEKYQSMKKNVEFFELRYKNAESTIQNYLGKEHFSMDELSGIKTDQEDVNQARKFLLTIYTNGFTPGILDEMKKVYKAYLDYHLNLDFEPRSIIADNVEDINDKHYGNSQVNGPGNDHGTFVAGIIAANRNNDFGINGIADPVEIMVLRTVPDGDERDKDIALSIKYAVDKGAKVINMSFGKDFSPQKYMIDDAIRYAESHNVLLVHAAGNDGMNIDVAGNFPNDIYNDGLEATNMITVGASSRVKGIELSGIFSNYGTTNVDLFAPGVDVVSLVPEGRYKSGDGTSYAAPVVSGVAALLLAYYPQLSPQQVKEIILKSVTPLAREKVFLPNLESSDKKKTRFGKLSKTGGIVNAYNAFKLAEKY